jgi:L-fuconolactonase
MRVDAHQHFWRLARNDYGWLTQKDTPAIYRDFLPADLAPHLKAAGVDKTVLVQCAETVAETEFLLALAKEAPFIAGVVGWVDLTARDASDQIARLSANGTLKGVRPMLQNLAEDDWVLQPSLEPAIAALKAQGLRLDILIFPRHLPHVARFFARHPDLAMVIDHGAKPYIARGEIEPWRTDMLAIARDFPNVCCKLSGLATEAAADWSIETLRPYVGVLLDAFGPARLMWGSDWPVLNMAGNYPGWFATAQKLTQTLTSAERDDVFGRTAARFYALT